jgi:hypothetical protein
MDNNNINAPSNENISNGDIVCDILILIFIALFAYYILSDKFEGFSSANPKPTLMNTNPQQIKKQVSFSENSENSVDESDLISNVLDSMPEHIPSIENNEIAPKSKPKSKSKSKSGLSDPYDLNLSGADKSLMLMNQNAKKNKKNYSCDLLGLNSDDMNTFKKDYYGMYAHQIECPKNCHMNKLGTKKCDLSSDKDCNGVFTTDYNNPDVFALSYMSLLNNNKKSCVTCTEDVKQQDKERLKQMKLTTANASNVVNFSNNVNLNSAGETPVDKMAEIRSCETGTCNLKDFGKSIKNVYDNLVTTPVYTNKNTCDPYQLTGFNGNTLLGDNFAPYSANK